MIHPVSSAVHDDTDGDCNGCSDRGYQTLHIVCPHPKGAFVMRLCRKCIRQLLPDMEEFVR